MIHNSINISNCISTIYQPLLTLLTLHFGRPRILPEKPALAAPSRVPGTPTRTPRSGSDAATPPRRQAEAEKGGTYFSMGVTPIAGWFKMENPNIKWMMAGGTLG